MKLLSAIRNSKERRGNYLTFNFEGEYFTYCGSKELKRCHVVLNGNMNIMAFDTNGHLQGTWWPPEGTSAKEWYREALSQVREDQGYADLSA